MFKNFNKINILYYITAGLLPSIFLFFLYTNNLGNIFLRLDHALFVASVLGVMGVLVLAIFHFTSKNIGISLVLCVFAWIYFWFFESLMGLFGVQTAIGRWIALFIFGGVLLAAALATRLTKLARIELLQNKIIASATSGIVLLMFVFHFGSAIWAGGIATLTGDDGGRFEHIRGDFNINSRLDSPNIYWIHIDGMLGFSAKEHFFDDAQEEFAVQLSERGFLIDPDAMLNVSGTWTAMPALWSPGFYDNYYSALLENSNHYVLGANRNQYLQRHFDADIGNWALQIDPYPELFHAFRNAGYTTVIQGYQGSGFTPLSTTYFYDFSDGVNIFSVNHEFAAVRSRFFAGIDDMVEMLALTTPVSLFFNRLRNINIPLEWYPMPEHSEKVAPLILTRDFHVFSYAHEKALYNALFEAFEKPSPRLVVTSPMFAHNNMWDYADPFAPGGYIVNHDLARGVLITMVDLILEHDPHAVIVIQADHGFHTDHTQRLLRADGMIDYDLFKIIHSTMNAVRIPERYGGLNAPIAPINVTRELINRFVGQNYELAQPHVNPIPR